MRGRAVWTERVTYDTQKHGDELDVLSRAADGGPSLCLKRQHFAVCLLGRPTDAEIRKRSGPVDTPASRRGR